MTIIYHLRNIDMNSIKNKLKLSEAWPENLGGLHRPGFGQLRPPRPVSSPGPKACEFLIFAFTLKDMFSNLFVYTPVYS